MAVYTLFGQPASPATLAADATVYTMGVQFSVTGSGCTLTGIWFFSGTGATTLPVTIALYQVSGTSLVTSQAASWSGAAGSGWVRAAFTTPPSLASGTQYEACVFSGGVTGNWYSATAHYWDTGAGSGGVTNGPLTAPNNAGAANGQDCFNTSLSLAYPATSFNATNYWMDPEVTQAAAPGGGQGPPPLTVPPGLWTAPGAVFPQPVTGDPSFSPFVPPAFPWLSNFVPGLARPGYATPANPDATFTTSVNTGSGAVPAAAPPFAPPFTTPSSWSQPWVPPSDPSWQGTAPWVPPFTRPASPPPRRQHLRRSAGQFFMQAWGQANQGTQFPLQLQQPQRERLTLRRSAGRFFHPGQFNLTAPQLPSFTSQAASARRTARTVRPARGQFFTQAWGQAGQGVTFPLYSRQQPALTRLALRRSQGKWLSPGQFNLTAPVLPAFTRQPQPQHLTVRYPRGRFFQQAWGQGNAGVPFPLWLRQPTPRLLLRRSQGQFFMQAWGQVPPPAAVTSGAEQYPQVTPPFTTPASWWQPWVPPSDPGIQVPPVPVPAVPPQFAGRQQRPVPARAPRGQSWGPGQFTLAANPSLPRITRTSRRDLIWWRRGRFFSPVMPQAVIPAYPPDFRTTRRFNFTRLDAARRGRIIQLVPFQSPSLLAVLEVRPGTPYVSWVTGEPYTAWVTGEAYA